MKKSKERNQQSDGGSLNQFYRRPLPEMCIDFTSSEGKVVFAEALASGYMECYFKLISQYRTQDEIAYCGITSLVMALNALEVDPGRIWKGPWRWYHESMLDCCTSLEIARQKGINMTQFVCLAKCNGLHPFAVSGSDIITLDLLREEVKRVTKREDVVMIVSYSRGVLGQTGDGHFSPIAGYHEGRDLVLILDTARFKYPPHWVKLQTLLDAMKTIDLDTGKSRGYVLLSIAKDQIMPLLFRPSCELSIDLERGSLSPELLNFDKKWKEWLKTSASLGSIQEDIINHCTQQLLTMLAEGHFKKGFLCLTMPFNTCFADDLKIESLLIDCESLHVSVRNVIFAFKSLFVEMESTKTFKAVKLFLSTKSSGESAMFLRMVQCYSDSLEDHPCQQPSENREKAPQSKACQNIEANCEGPCKERVSPFPLMDEKSLVDLPFDNETGQESKCNFKFDVRPEHVATVFLFVWPHDLYREAKSSSSCKMGCLAKNLVVDSETGVSSCSNGSKETQKKKQNENGASQLSEQRSTLGDALIDFLRQDLDETKRSYFRGEIKAMMIKFHEVLQYHSHGD